MVSIADRIFVNIHAMRKRVYIETTVVSYYCSKLSKSLLVSAQQKATRLLWPRLTLDFKGYVSALVFDEASKGNKHQAAARLRAIAHFEMLEVEDEAQVLALHILEDRAMPREYPEDALHIAVCAVNGMDLLLTWNFAHLNNPFTRLRIRRSVEARGFECPEICSPNELLELEP